MLNSVKVTTRELLVDCRTLAMQGQAVAAIKVLEAANEFSTASLDGVVLRMLKAEILHLDFQDEAAYAAFPDASTLENGQLEDRVSLVLSYNRSDIAFTILRPDDEYATTDTSRLAGVELWNHKAVARARMAADKGKHFDALPIVWREVLRTYEQGCWRVHRSACSEMGRECLQLNWPHDAAFYAILARQKGLCQDVGQFLLQHGTEESLSKSVERILSAGNLRRHFCSACSILSSMSDAIPDSQVSRIFDWVLTYASWVPVHPAARPVPAAAWELLTLVAHRLSQNDVERLIDAATSHHVWTWTPEVPNQIELLRQQIVETVDIAVEHYPVNRLVALTNTVLPLAQERMQIHDLPHVMNLLCHIASRSNDAKELVAKKIYPPGKQVGSTLVEAARHFGKDITDPMSLGKAAEQTARDIRLQVQRVPKGTEVTSISGSYMVHTVELADEMLYRHSADSIHIRAILDRRQHVPSEQFEELIDAIFDMIQEPDNLLANKTQLIRCLGIAADCCSETLAARVFDVLSPLAGGDVMEPSHVMSSAEAENPLNPFKMSSGKPSDVQATALHTLGLFEKETPGVFGRDMNDLLILGLSDTDSTVRSLAFAAAKVMSALNEPVTMAVLMGTRDHDPGVAAHAFSAIANKPQLTRPQWRLFTYSTKMAARSLDVRLRRAAAFATSRLLPSAPTSAIRTELEELRESLAADRCFSVRQNAEMPESAPAS